MSSILIKITERNHPNDILSRILNKPNLFKFIYMISIKAVATKQDKRDFVKFPFKLYQNNPNWVPQITQDEIKVISKETNPAFEFCDAQYWMAYKDGEPVGRIGGIINRRYNEKVGKNCARFSQIDFIDDPEVSTVLLKTVEDWAKSKGAAILHGPFGFTDMDPEGMLVEGFDELGTIATIYNHPYYPFHMERQRGREDLWLDHPRHPMGPHDGLPDNLMLG